MKGFPNMRVDIPPSQDTTDKPKITWAVQFVINVIGEDEAKEILAAFPNAQRTPDDACIVIKADQNHAEGVALWLKRQYPEAEILMPPHKPPVFIISSG